MTPRAALAADDATAIEHRLRLRPVIARPQRMGGFEMAQLDRRVVGLGLDLRPLHQRQKAGEPHDGRHALGDPLGLYAIGRVGARPQLGQKLLQPLDGGLIERDAAGRLSVASEKGQGSVFTLHVRAQDKQKSQTSFNTAEETAAV